ncbi:MAG: hypothetical protein R3B48_29375 [Kofleriaceae bacterium]
MACRFSSEDLTRLRRALLRRGMVLATLLAEVLAGKRPPEVTRLLAARPGMRPHEVLRLALDQVDGRRALIDAGDDRFGRCDVCGEDLGLIALEEVPWADRCHQHGGQ